jgi:hypothetical protein
LEQSQDYFSTGDRTAELNIHLKKLSDVSFTIPASTVGLQLLNLRLLEVILRCVKDGVMTIKPGHQTTGNARVIWADESSLTLFPTSGRVYVWDNSQGSMHSRMPVPTVKNGGGSVMVWAAISWYSVG